MSAPALIAVDWGTSSCRAALLDAGGNVQAQRDGGQGILAVAAGGFEVALQSFVGPWLQSGQRVPIIMSGMIGSRQGWREAPYVRCPASLDEVAAHLFWIDSAALGRIALIPGLDDHQSGTPDVLRGEEAQIFGALSGGSGVCVLPGTHSKWATVRAGRIVAFRSFMTGEVFAALKDHTILGRLMIPSDTPDDAAFLRGVRDGAKPGGAGSLLNRMFAARTLGLFDHVPAAGLADYLSGLLIGAEIADNPTTGPATITLIGSATLTARYAAACTALGIAVAAAPVDCAAKGAFAIARAARLLGA